MSELTTIELALVVKSLSLSYQATVNKILRMDNPSREVLDELVLADRTLARQRSELTSRLVNGS